MIKSLSVNNVPSDRARIYVGFGRDDLNVTSFQQGNELSTKIVDNLLITVLMKS